MRRTTRWLTVVALAIALAGAAVLSACIIPRFDPDCPDTADCGSCIDTSGCGFCARDSRCIPGTSLGPDDHDACAPANWRFDSCAGPPRNTPCPHTECGICTVSGDNECGWCFTTGECWPTVDPPSDCPLAVEWDSCN
jgi:hypothetical protein